MAYGDFEDLNRRTFAAKVFCNKAFDIAEDPKYDDYQHGFASMVYKFFDKKPSVSGVKNIPNKELVEELHKPIIRNFNKKKVHSPCTDNIWGAELADMQLVSKFNKRFRFLLSAIDIYSKDPWVIP